jgi:hypothetical protein
VALSSVVARARLLVREVARAEELAERRRAQSVENTGLDVKSTARGTLLPREAPW